MIKIMQPLMPSKENLAPYLDRIDESRIYSNFGPLYGEFTAHLAEYFGVDNDGIVIVSNATLGLLGSLSVSSAALDQTLFMPSWTFTASASAAVFSNRNVEFVDVGNDWRADFPVSARFKLDVLPFGDTFEEQRYSDEDFVVIDGAASFDSLRNVGERLKRNQVLAVSFHATKLVGAGEAGVCISNNRELIQKLKVWSNFGFEGSRHSASIGINAKVSEYTAAVGLASFAIWEESRSILADQLAKAQRVSESLKLETHAAMKKGYVSPYWIVELPSREFKSQLVRQLNSDGIESRDWWESGCHRMAAYSEIKRCKMDFTERLGSLTLGLPFHAFLKDSDYERIHASIEKAFQSFL